MISSQRNMVKWQPFNAVATGNYMVDEVLKTKNKIQMPLLSDDQKEELQNKMFWAFNNQETITVKYYRDGRFYILNGKITFIDRNKYRIAINNKNWIYFSQIIDFL